MCTLAIALQVHEHYPLIVVANRDEFYDRPTRRAGFWADKPQLFGGRDEKAGGTWMASSRTGRFACLTNFRDPHNIRPDAPSRGALPVDFLASNESAQAFLARLAPTASAYNGFNLLVFDGETLAYFSNYDPAGPRVLPPGTYGLSNALLDTPWPKLVSLRNEVQGFVQASRLAPSELSALLDRPATFPDDQLPSTGVPIERERQLSALRIHIPDLGPEGYGTCVSTVVLQGPAHTEWLEVNQNPRRVQENTAIRVSFPLRLA